jgi:hypothetical protein
MTDAGVMDRKSVDDYLKDARKGKFANHHHYGVSEIENLIKAYGEHDTVGQERWLHDALYDALGRDVIPGPLYNRHTAKRTLWQRLVRRVKRWL